VFNYATRRIARLTRPGTPEAADFVNKVAHLGRPGPRASMNLILAPRRTPS